MTVSSGAGGEEATTSSPSVTTIASISRTPAARARRWTSSSSSGTPTTTRPIVSPSSPTTSTALLAGHESLPARSSSPAMRPTFPSASAIRSAASAFPVASARCTCMEPARRSACSWASVSASANSSRPTRMFAASRVSTVSRSWLCAIRPATQVASTTTTAASASPQRTCASLPRAARGGNLASVAVVPPSLRAESLERGRAHVGRDQQEDHGRRDQAVDDEDRVVVPAHVAEEAPDRQEAASGRRDHSDDERPFTARRQVAEQDVGDALPERGPEDDGDEEQEGEARRRVPVEPEEARHRDRDPGARDPWHEGEALGETDRERGSGPEIGHLLGRGRLVGNPEEDAEDDEEDRDLPRLPEVACDQVLAERADYRGRDGCDGDEPGDPLVGRGDAAPSDAREPGRDQAGDVVPEVGDHGDQGPDVEGDVERLVELLVRLEVLPLEEPRDEDQMARRGDRKELGGALHDAEHERLPVRQRSRHFADAGDGQEGGDGESPAGDDQDAGATHGRVIVRLR